MFSWSKDRELFMNGPYTFRIVTQPKEDPLECLSGLRDFFVFVACYSNLLQAFGIVIYINIKKKRVPN